MKYIVIESKLKTNKSRNYLWNIINTPKKIIKAEGFDKNSKIKKISQNNYELATQYGIVLLGLIPKKGVNMVFVNKRNFPLTWFEISGEKNCTITHGEYKRVDKGMSKSKWAKEIAWVKNHLLEELKEIAK